MAEPKKAVTAKAPSSSSSSADKRMAAKIQALEARADRAERTIVQLLLGNIYNARETWGADDG